MKLRNYFIKNYIKSILILGIMYCLFGYVFLISKQFLGIFAIFIISFVLLNRRIILYEDKIKIIQGYKKIEIEIDLITSLQIDDYKPMFSQVNIPAIYVEMKNTKKKIFYYSSYSKESIAEIINYVIEKNNFVDLDSNIRELIKNKESKYDIKRKKDVIESFI